MAKNKIEVTEEFLDVLDEGQRLELAKSLAKAITRAKQALHEELVAVFSDEGLVTEDELEEALEDLE